ncbi:DUF1576 domain-containing protein [Breznakia pachnodae]|uniref:DUF1576 domain-containing protein n=1 Tax=Breznakia pachnodae TaxID=265178 RepID=A0ABU0DZX4_9FIRM|nr:DUF1576 domain-containing protein [Breznakia pachnodae]MDQ0359840.1 hypothetical protein [Breznakia pachnodae]
MFILNITRLYETNRDSFLKRFLFSIGFIFVVSSIFLDSPQRLFNGIYTIITCSDRLITDYVQLVGFGATFLNAGLLMMISVVILHLSKAKISGMAIAAVFLMGGFGMFGKNIANIWGIIFGVFLYSKYQKHSFSQYIYVAFFGTSLAPLSTELVLWKADWGLAIVFSFVIAAAIGFLLTPISNSSLVVHQGYNLYNVGFGAGLIGTIVVAIMGSFGYEHTPVLIWYEQHDIGIIIFIYLLFILFIIGGFLMDKDLINNYKKILKRSGRLVTDFLALEGFGVVLFNMGVLGIIYTSYVLAVGGHINGPTIGGILTIVGFGAFGKHVKNTIPITLGVVLGTLLKIWNINDPSVLLAALFGCGLAPIAGQFGLFYGMCAGFVHLSLVLSIGSYHGGMNLYNNGFSAGLVALFLIPIIETFYHKRKLKRE